MKRITGGDELNAIASLGLGNSCMKDENGVVTIEGRAVTSEEQPLIEAEVIRLNAAWDAVQYMRDRAEKYPRIQKQLDMQYWDQVNGTTTWKDAIAKVKADNPKE